MFSKIFIPIGRIFSKKSAHTDKSDIILLAANPFYQNADIRCKPVVETAFSVLSLPKGRCLTRHTQKISLYLLFKPVICTPFEQKFHFDIHSRQDISRLNLAESLNLALAVF